MAQLDVTQQPLLRSISQNLITARQIVNIHVSPPSTEVLLQCGTPESLFSHN